MILQLAVLFGLRSSIAQHMVHLLYYMYRIPSWECWVIVKIVLLGSSSSKSYTVHATVATVYRRIQTPISMQQIIIYAPRAMVTDTSS